MIDRVLASNENTKNIIKAMYNDLKNKITNKDISLPYTIQLSKSTYLKIDGNGNMYLNNGGKYTEIGSITQDSLDINKIYNIFNIVNQKEQWDINPYTNMPTARYGLGCIEYNGKIYCIGGAYAGNYTNKIEVYDTSSNSWSTNYTTMPTGRYNFGCVEYNGKIYCIGGQGSATYNNFVEVYDIQSNTWSNSYNIMPTPRRLFGCVQYKGKIYCIGGTNSGYLSKVEVYDILSNTWSSNYNTMRTTRQSFGCVEYNGKIYCIGGSNTSGSISLVEVYDIVSNTWSANYNSIPTSIYGFGCIQYNGKIYCVGGYNSGYKYLNMLQIYDILSNTWISGDSMSSMRQYVNCIEYNGKVYCIGGHNDTILYFNTIEVLLLKILTFNIPIPDSLYTKLNEIITNGDGTKVFHNNGKYSAINPTYQVMSQDEISSYLLELN